jgi:hypothetical protein
MLYESYIPGMRGWDLGESHVEANVSSGDVVILQLNGQLLEPYSGVEGQQRLNLEEYRNLTLNQLLHLQCSSIPSEVLKGVIIRG